MRAAILFVILLAASPLAWTGEAEAKPEVNQVLGTPKLRGKVTIKLDDAEAYHKDAPKTFKIPNLLTRQNLKNGTIVKLIFRFSDASTTQVESMWVIVKSRRENTYTGTLDNDPYCTDTIKSGLEVQFEPKHIIDIWTDDPETPKK